MGIKKRLGVFVPHAQAQGPVKAEMQKFVARMPLFGFIPMLRDADNFSDHPSQVENFDHVLVHPEVRRRNAETIQSVYQARGIPVTCDGGMGPLDEIREFLAAQEEQMEQNRQAEEARLEAARTEAEINARNALRESTGSQEPLEPLLTEAQKNNPGNVDPRLTPEDGFVSRVEDPAFQQPHSARQPIEGDINVDEQREAEDGKVAGDATAAHEQAAAAEDDAKTGQDEGQDRGDGQAPTGRSRAKVSKTK